MISNRRIAVLLLPLLFGCAAPIKYQPVYPGDNRTDDQLAKYWPTNIQNYFSSINIYTASVDGAWYNDKFSPALMLEPGEHEVIVTFVQINMPYGGYNDVRFPGNYVIKFNAKKGKLYAPMFNISLGDKSHLKEMCLAEVDNKDSLDETKNPKNFIKCAQATIDPYITLGKMCEDMQDKGWPIILKDRCTHEANKVFNEKYNPPAPNLNAK